MTTAHAISHYSSHQAQGMPAAQVDCSLDAALLLMRARARSSDLGRIYIAAAVLNGSIRFDE